MPRLQDQLALYGAIDEAVVAAHEPAVSSTVERFLPGTTGFGQRGWYLDVQRFLGNLAPGERARFPDLTTARADLIRRAGSGDGLPPAVTARVIFAEVILDRIARSGGDAQPGAADALSEMLSVAPSPSTNGDSEAPGTIGRQAGEVLALRIQEEVNDVNEFRAFMDSQSDVTISAAVASYDPKAFLRKVRGEYCSVITTDATWSDITFAELLAVVDPQNWDEFYHEFFCEMLQQGETAQGWNAVLETVSGDCGQYSMTTPLRFWKRFGPDDLFLNYDLNDDKAAFGDRLVLVDNGYVWITREGAGVRVRTSKELLIRGLSSAATTALAGGLGWADNASGMFRHGAQHPPANPVALTNSMAKGAKKASQSVPFPIEPPVLPSDIRVEGVNDTVDELKGTIASLAQFGTELMSRWSNGIDEDDVAFLGARLGKLVGDRSASFFDTASSNFRPVPIPKPSP